jgi:hypothetical protein
MCKLILDGLVLSITASLLLVIGLYIDPRLFLQDYPEEIQSVVPPKTPAEKRLALVVGIPFLLVLLLLPFFSTLGLKQANGDSASFISLFTNAFGILFIFNLVDWLLLDWLMFCTITPKFMVIPGTDGMAAYKDYGYHFRGFLIGTVFSIFGGVIIAVSVFFIG